MSNELDLLVSSEELVIKLEYWPFAQYYPKGKKMETSRETLISSILIRLNSFYKLIYDARANIGIKELIKYPENPDIKNLVALPYENLSNEARTTLVSETNKILSKYLLTQDWDISIATTILTHHLPVPIMSHGINIFLPYKPLSELDIKVKFLETFNDPALSKAIKVKNEENQAKSILSAGEATRHPAIYFTIRTSPTELIKWIKSNSQIIRHMNSFLPKKSDYASRLTVRTERVALVAIIFKQEGLHKWAAMTKEVERWAKRKDGDISDFFGTDGIPTPEDFRQAYKSYMGIVKRIEDFSES